MSRHREEAAPKAIRKFCPQCRYTLVQLSDFDGTSSLDAPKQEVYGVDQSSSVLGLGLFGLGTRLLWKAGSSLWSNKGAAKRRAQIQRLRQDVLPSDPEARICPHCLHLVMTGE